MFVPGAQTFESLKDLVVLLCIVLLGYPALIAVPPAYILGPDRGGAARLCPELGGGLLLLDRLCLDGLSAHRPESGFSPAPTWGRYGMFVVLIMLFDPIMWGFICSAEFTSAIFYRNILSALFFTLA